jgi:hypothetical protein
MRGSQFAELSAFVAVAEHRNFTRAAAVDESVALQTLMTGRSSYNMHRLPIAT